MLKLQDLYTYQTIDSGPRVRTNLWDKLIKKPLVAWWERMVSWDLWRQIMADHRTFLAMRKTRPELLMHSAIQ